MKLAFVTSNHGKFDFLRLVLEPLIEDGLLEGLDMITEVVAAVHLCDREYE